MSKTFQKFIEQEYKLEVSKVSHDFINYEMKGSSVWCENCNKEIRFRYVKKIAEFCCYQCDGNPFIETEARWRKDREKPDYLSYFNSKSEMLQYGMVIAEGEYNTLIKKGWGKHRAGAHISYKKWLAIDNGNVKYDCVSLCGHCFTWVDVNKKTIVNGDADGCKNSCVYGRLHPGREDQYCNTTNPEKMLERLSSCKIKELVREADSDLGITEKSKKVLDINEKTTPYSLNCRECSRNRFNRYVLSDIEIKLGKQGYISDGESVNGYDRSDYLFLCNHCKSILKFNLARILKPARLEKL